jgi:hypothetical protein
MNRWVAVLTAALVGGASMARAGEPVVVPGPAGCGGCQASCGADCGKGSCLSRVGDWLCYRPLRLTRPHECGGCVGVRPPLYLYFLRPCCEGAPNCCYPDCGGPKCHHCDSGHCGSGHHLFRRHGEECCPDGGCAAGAPDHAVVVPAAPATAAPVTVSSAKKVG